ncbi:nucleotidyltransferase domain-containing protein [Candidatus Pacearchaeota archaeon]|nr:nucleotidyltransferase domain-containing protein [Candidatus Pacearchaeota archaeon]
MDICKEQFTRLEKRILKLLFMNAGKDFNQREIAIALKISPTAVAKSIKSLKKTELLNIKKQDSSKTFEIGLNMQNNHVYFMKRIENLSAIYESGLAEYLFSRFPGSTIILFGSYSFGEDTQNSDIDIAIIGSKKREVEIKTFEKMFNKKIILQFYEDFNKLHKNLKESILNGIILKGSIKL